MKRIALVCLLLVSCKSEWIKLPVTVHCAGGYDLVIDSGDGGTTLSGGAKLVFDGEVEYGNRIQPRIEYA